MTRALVFALFLSLSASAATVDVSISPIERGDSATITVTIVNNSDADLPNAQLAIGMSERRSVQTLTPSSSNAWPCGGGRCGANIAPFQTVLHAHETVTLSFTIAPANEGRFSVQAFALWGTGNNTRVSDTVRSSALFYRTIRVTNSDDDGPGSLRQAFVAANDCTRDEVPCRVEFDALESPIRLSSALPVLTLGELILDATPNTIEIDGYAAKERGIEIHGAGAAIIRGLALRNFPGNAIDVSFNAFRGGAIENNVITGSQLRAIEFHAPSTSFKVAHNVLSGNGRSGVFIMGGEKTYASEIEVSDNVIEGNGASGIFVGPHGERNRILRNRIANNGDFGIAIARDVQWVDVEENTVAHNRILGIDVGLDGFSGFRYDDYDLVHAYIPPPTLESATFDAIANETTITGRHIVPSYGSSTVFVYANGGEVFLGKTKVADDGTFAIAIEGDVRDTSLTAYALRYLNLGFSGDYQWTSELAPIDSERRTATSPLSGTSATPSPASRTPRAAADGDASPAAARGRSAFDFQ